MVNEVESWFVETGSQVLLTGSKADGVGDTLAKRACAAHVSVAQWRNIFDHWH